jgi:hypothetical protein
MSLWTHAPYNLHHLCPYHCKIPVPTPFRSGIKSLLLKLCIFQSGGDLTSFSQFLVQGWLAPLLWACDEAGKPWWGAYGEAKLLTSWCPGNRGRERQERTRDKYLYEHTSSYLLPPQLLKFSPPPQIVQPAGDQPFNTCGDISHSNHTTLGQTFSKVILR